MVSFVDMAVMGDVVCGRFSTWSKQSCSWVSRSAMLEMASVKQCKDGEERNRSSAQTRKTTRDKNSVGKTGFLVGLKLCFA